MTCFVSIYKCFARPSQGLFLCTALSCRALTVLHAAPSWCFCNTASTSQSIAVWDPRGIASVCGGNSCIGEQQLVGFGCPAHAHISGPRSAPLRPTPAAPTNQSIAFSDPRGTACVGGGRFVHRRTRARRICPCSPRRGLLGRRLRHQSPSLSLAMVSESRNMQH